MGYAAGYGGGLRIGRVREGNCKECGQGGGGDNGRKRVKKGHAVVWCGVLREIRRGAKVLVCGFPGGRNWGFEGEI